MNEKKVRLEKSVGIINLILGIFETIGGFLFLVLSGTIAEMFNGTFGNAGTGAATIKGTGRPDGGQAVRYYDVEADGWRSFKVENLIAIYQ